MVAPGYNCVTHACNIMHKTFGQEKTNDFWKKKKIYKKN